MKSDGPYLNELKQVYKVADPRWLRCSGGWALQPNLNISALTTAGAEMPGWSWPASLWGRSHGSVYAAVVREALIKMEDEKLTQHHPAPSGDILTSQIIRPFRYADLARVIHSTLLNDVDRLSWDPILGKR